MALPTLQTSKVPWTMVLERLSWHVIACNRMFHFVQRNLLTFFVFFKLVLVFVKSLLCSFLLFLNGRLWRNMPHCKIRIIPIFLMCHNLEFNPSQMCERPAQKTLNYKYLHLKNENNSQIWVSVPFCLTCRLAAGSLARLNSGSKPGGTTFCASNVSWKWKTQQQKTVLTC